MSEKKVLEMKGITKIYPGVRALDGVDFIVEEGSVHALMGENGAGKSTLIKILTGVIGKDSGSIVLSGKEVNFHSVYEANNNGISAVYQELDLIPELSIGENIFMGREMMKKGSIDWKNTYKEADKILKSMGILLDVTAKLSSLGTAMQQMVSIARAISIKSQIVVLDEPTSSLDTSEVEVLFKVIEKLKRDKIAVIFITHRLDEVFATCDTVTILKDGKLVHRCKIEETNKLDMVSKMIGRNASDVMGQTKVCLSDRSPKEIFLEAKGMKKFPKVIEQSIKIRKGEVLGLAGLLGAGRTELARLLFGADTCKEGTIEIEGKPVKINTPRDAISNRIAFCSEDRKVEGIIPNMSISNNLTLACLKSISKWGVISKRKQKALVQKYIEMLKIKIGNEKDPIIVFAVTFGVGIFWGFLNGFMVAKMDIVPFIATLATMVGVRGIVHIITGSKSVSTAGCTEVFKAIGHGELIPYVPNTILIYLVVFAICMFVQRNTRYGRHNYAVGGNLSASKMMGINGTRIRILNYVLSGVMAAIAALIMTSRLGSGQYSAGDGWEMDAIASTVIGGTLLTGGVGDVKGTFFGVLILGIIKQIFNLQGNLNTWWQNIATGLILLAVVVAQSIAKNRK